MKLGGFFSELLRPVRITSHFEWANLFRDPPQTGAATQQSDRKRLSIQKLLNTENGGAGVDVTKQRLLTSMHELCCLNMSVWKRKVRLSTSPEKTLACQPHSAGPVTEVAWYWAHVSYSVVNGVSSELFYSLAAKHTDCPLCVHNKCKTILRMVFTTSGANGKNRKHNFTLSDGILNCILHMNASRGRLSDRRRSQQKRSEK